MAKKPIVWRAAGVLSALGLVGLLGSLPFLLPVSRAVIERVPGPLPLPLPLILVLGLVQQTLLIVVLTCAGYMLAKKTGLGAPLVEGWLSGIRPGALPWSTLRLPLGLGLAVGAALSLLFLWWLLPRFPQLPLATAARFPFWQRMGSCFGGIVEELISRLFLMSLLAWLLGRFWRQPDGRPAAAAMWLANVVATILFGLGHLPMASLFMPITPLVVVAALLLNGVAGIVFGWLYAKRGIEAAMVAHFSCDFMVWGITPLFMSA